MLLLFAQPIVIAAPKNLPELQQLKLDAAQEYCLGYKVPDPKNFDVGQGAAIWTGIAEPFGLMHDVRGALRAVHTTVLCNSGQPLAHEFI